MVRPISPSREMKVLMPRAGYFRFADTIYYACHTYLARTLTPGRLSPENRRFVYAGLAALSMGTTPLSPLPHHWY
jgi:hypothetical protein